MSIKSLLTLIASAVLKRTVAPAFSEILEIYSIFETISGLSDCLSTESSCQDLGIHSVTLVAEGLSKRAIDDLLDAGSDRFLVERKKSGVYIASRMAPRFKARNLSFPQPTENHSAHNTRRRVSVYNYNLERTTSISAKQNRGSSVSQSFLGSNVFQIIASGIENRIIVLRGKSLQTQNTLVASGIGGTYTCHIRPGQGLSVTLSGIRNHLQIARSLRNQVVVEVQSGIENSIRYV